MKARIGWMVMRLSSGLASSRSGRVTLHLACMLAGSDRNTHWRGIGRELRGL